MSVVHGIIRGRKGTVFVLMSPVTHSLPSQSPGGVAPCPAPPPLPPLVPLWAESWGSLPSVLPPLSNPALLPSHLKDMVICHHSNRIFFKAYGQITIWSCIYVIWVHLDCVFLFKFKVLTKIWICLFSFSSIPLLPTPPNPSSDPQSCREGARPCSWEDSHLPPSSS